MRMLRESKLISQAKLAAMLRDRGIELHPSAIAKMEARDAESPRAIRLNEAGAIADALGETLSSMTTGDVFEGLSDEELLSRLKESNASLSKMHKERRELEALLFGIRDRMPELRRQTRELGDAMAHRGITLEEETDGER